MQLAANARLVRSRVRLATVLHFAALIAFGLGFIISLQVPELWFYPYLAILVGLVLYQVAQSNLRRYGPRHRLDAVFGRLLKGLPERFTLVAFADPGLPDYILVGPTGVTALVPRANRGTVVCRGDRWSLEGGNRLFRILRAPLGNPSADARQAVSQINARLAQSGVDPDAIPVNAMIVFLHPEARLRIESCSFPVTSGKDLRHHFRRVKGGLSPSAVADVRRALVRFEQG